MLRDNLAGLIEPRLSSAGAHNLGGHPKRDKLGDAPGQPSWRSSLLNDPSAKFFAANPGDGQKNKWPGLKVTTPAHDSRAVRTAHHKSHRTIDPQCLENPRPEGAESTLTKNAASPFPAEPRHLNAPYGFGSSRNDDLSVPFVGVSTTAHTGARMQCLRPIPSQRTRACRWTNPGRSLALRHSSWLVFDD